MGKRKELKACGEFGFVLKMEMCSFGLWNQPMNE